MRAWLKTILLPCVLLTLPPAGLAAEADRDPGLKKVVQVAFVVRDIEATTKHWANMLGVSAPRVFTTRPGREASMVVHGQPSNARIKLAFIQTESVQLEFIQPIDDEPSSWREFLAQHGEGVQHLGFVVADPVKASAALEQAGMPLVHRGRYDSLDGDYLYHDSAAQLGVMVELLHSDAKR